MWFLVPRYSTQQVPQKKILYLKIILIHQLFIDITSINSPSNTPQRSIKCRIIILLEMFMDVVSIKGSYVEAIRSACKYNVLRIKFVIPKTEDARERVDLYLYMYCDFFFTRTNGKITMSCLLDVFLKMAYFRILWSTKKNNFLNHFLLFLITYFCIILKIFQFLHYILNKRIFNKLITIFGIYKLMQLFVGLDVK